MSHLGTIIFTASKSMEAVDGLHLHHLGKTISYFIGPRHGNANVAQFFFPTLIESRNRIDGEDDPEVALARFVYRRAGAVGEVAATEDDRGDAVATEVRLERRLEERSPARLIDDDLAVVDLLDLASEQEVWIEPDGRIGE